MSPPEGTADERMRPPSGAGGVTGLSLLYGTALLLSALLLFWIQPLFTKMVLPLFGGAPAVWTTASMFFQVALLAGYLYAHLISRRLSLGRQALVHLALLLAVFVLLPVRLDGAVMTPADREPVVALLWLLASCLGLPFFAIAATAPLLQRWFSRTRHAEAMDPYFLYSASNLGSMLALLGYPVLIEPLFGLAQQTRLWALGYALLALLIAVSAHAMWRHRRDPAPEEARLPATAHPLGWVQRGRWMLLAAAPSSLLLGVTQHITTEIAAVPLLWVAPLALYMLTYVNVFARRPPIRHEWMVKVQPPLVILLALVWVLNNQLWVFGVHLVAFFVTAMMCHGELARERPHPEKLTEFYLCIALGGAVGGGFNAIVAPLAFDSILEYPLVIGLACMLRRTNSGRTARLRASDCTWPLLLGSAFAVLSATGYRPLSQGTIAIVVYLQVVGMALYLAHRRPFAFGLTVTTVLLASPVVHNPEEVLARHRTFFGVHTVLKHRDAKFHLLLHGITIHGAQYIAPGKRQVLTTYFHRDSPLGQLFTAVGTPGRFQLVAAVGLGAGTVACYRQPGQKWTFFEIDPAIVQLASDTRYFTFLADCAPDARIVVGDGRLSLAATPDAHFDLIIIDTFSSDSIPVHMITREALALYLRKLSARGVVIFHITNQYVELTPVLADLAAAAGVAAFRPGPRLTLPPEDRFEQMESHWIAIARQPEYLAALESEEGWLRLSGSAAAPLWTDDHSNIVGALKYSGDSAEGRARAVR
jgi:hypothetical protein